MTASDHSPPRVAPLTEPEWNDRVRRLLAPLPRDQSGRLPNSITTLVRHHELFARFLPYALQLLGNGRLPARDRELLILRTASNCDADYEWGRHVRIATEAGISGDDVKRVAAGPQPAEWSARDRLLLCAADELHQQARLSDDTWEALAGFYTIEDLIELLLLVGQYHMTAFALNSLRVAPDPGFASASDDPHV